MKPLVKPLARKQGIELVGFWVAWHLYGGFEGPIERAGMHPSTVWRKVKKFRVAFKEHPDVYGMPGVTIDPATFWEHAATLQPLVPPRPTARTRPRSSGTVNPTSAPTPAPSLADPQVREVLRGRRPLPPRGCGAVRGPVRPAGGPLSARAPLGAARCDAVGQVAVVLRAALRQAIENLDYDAEAVATAAVEATELAARFEEVPKVLDEVRLPELWPYATEAERRTLLDELVESVTVHPDRLTVHLHGAPPLNVAFPEAGLKDSELSGVGGGT